MPRTRTEFKRLIIYKINEKSRLLKARILRYLPLNIRDTIIEKKYKKILGENKKVIKIEPGSSAAAPGESQNITY